MRQIMTICDKVSKLNLKKWGQGASGAIRRRATLDGTNGLIREHEMRGNLELAQIEIPSWVLWNQTYRDYSPRGRALPYNPQGTSPLTHHGAQPRTPSSPEAEGCSSLDLHPRGWGFGDMKVSRARSLFSSLSEALRYRLKPLTLLKGIKIPPQAF